MNLTATTSRSTTATWTQITRTTAVTSKTTNYEILGYDTSGYGLTQATIISEPYFDAQTPRNVTGLVGKRKISIVGTIFQFSPLLKSHQRDVHKPPVSHLTITKCPLLSPESPIRKIGLFELSCQKLGEQNRLVDSPS